MNQRDIHLEKLYQYLIEGYKFGPAMRKVGVWSDSYSNTPIRLKETKKYNRFMDKKLRTLGDELAKLMLSMREHDITDEDYKIKVDAYEKLTKIKLLLEGEATDNININVIKEKTTEELMALAFETDGEDDEESGGPGVSPSGTSEEDTDTVPSV